MPEFPTIVRQRLRAGEDRKGLHPDADTLTAYVEQLLPGHERDYVMRHLSVCAECRDVVTLTMPEVTAEAEVQEVAVPAIQPEPSIMPVAARARRSWFFTPAFGMAASVAAMALGLILVLRLDHDRAPVASVQQAQQQTQARTEPGAAVPEQPAGKSAETAPSFAPQPAPPPPPSPSAAQSAQVGAETRGASRVAANRANEPSRALAGVPAATNKPAVVADLRKDYLNSQLLFANSADVRSAQELPQAPQPAFSSNLNFSNPVTGAVGGSLGQNNAYLQVPANTGQAQTMRFYPLSRPQGSSILDKIVDAGKLPLHAKKLAPAIRARETERLSMFSPGLTLADNAQAAPVAKSESGEGKSELAQSHAFTRRALLPAGAARLNEPVTQWKVAQGKLLKSTDLSSWFEAYPASEGIQFTVVSGNGPDIWAGGSKVALVHSRDNGATWDKVRLGVAASGDVMAIEGGGLTLQVKTSTGQTWATNDGGASWAQR